MTDRTVTDTDSFESYIEKARAYLNRPDVGGRVGGTVTAVADLLREIDRLANAKTLSARVWRASEDVDYRAKAREWLNDRERAGFEGIVTVGHEYGIAELLEEVDETHADNRMLELHRDRYRARLAVVTLEHFLPTLIQRINRGSLPQPGAEFEWVASRDHRDEPDTIRFRRVGFDDRILLTVTEVNISVPVPLSGDRS